MAQPRSGNIDALVDLDLAGRLADEDRPEPRYVLLADPDRAPIAPLLERLLLDRSAAVLAFWERAHWSSLRLRDLL